MDPTQSNPQNEPGAGQAQPQPAPPPLSSSSPIPPSSQPGWGPYGAPAGAPWAGQPGPGWPAVPVYPVQPRGRRLRWAIALSLVLIVVVVTVAGAFVLSGAAGGSKSLTAGYAPKSTILFLDVRADLPGDQHQNLADFMSHFPGFKDRAQFDNAFDDILNRITGSISPDLTYTWALKGWTTGELSLAVTGLGLPTSSTAANDINAIMSAMASGLDAGMGAQSNVAPMSVASTPSGVLIVGVKDRAAGEKWVSSEVTRAGATFTSQSYAGTQLYVSSSPVQGETMAYAFTDKAFVAGDENDVKAALDAPARGSLADQASYTAAMKSLSGDCIAVFYADPATLLKSELSLMGGMGIAMPSLPASSFPSWMAGSIRAESDRIQVEMKMPKAASGATSPGNKTSELASELPGSTVAVLEYHSIGKLLTQTLDTMAGQTGTTPDVQSTVKQIQDALRTIGGIDWIGDAAVVVTAAGSNYGGGLVIQTPDASTAAGKKTMITNLISLAGTSYGLTQSDETYKGTTITVIGIPGSMTGTGAASGQTKIGIAVKDNVLVVGMGDEFAKAMIDTTSGNSLVSQSDYRTVMAAVGDSNYGYGYMDVPALADQLGPALFGQVPSASSNYQLNYKPYIDHLGGVAFAAIDGDTVTLRFVVTAR